MATAKQVRGFLKNYIVDDPNGAYIASNDPDELCAEVIQHFNKGNLYACIVDGPVGNKLLQIGNGRKHGMSVLFLMQIKPDNRAKLILTLETSSGSATKEIILTESSKRKADKPVRHNQNDEDVVYRVNNPGKIQVDDNGYLHMDKEELDAFELPDDDDFL